MIYHQKLDEMVIYVIKEHLTIFVGEMTDGDIRNEDIPMTYSYYHKVIKGTSPKNAPTYIAE